jgi:large subunit ribosomal protein L23
MQKHNVNILIAPRITEKGAYLSQAGVYVFNVVADANKRDIAAAVKDIYKVTPRKVTVVTVPHKVVQTRGTNRKGATGGGKKAYVFLKKGDTIDII